MIQPGKPMISLKYFKSESFYGIFIQFKVIKVQIGSLIYVVNG